jgi:hypothetical protein
MVVPGSNLLTKTLEIPKGQADPAGAIEPLLNPGDITLKLKKRMREINNLIVFIFDYFTLKII